jgi:SAM-dependent methyltransferase
VPFTPVRGPQETKLDIFTRLSSKSDYSTPELQLIVGAWVMSTLFERQAKVSTSNGDMSEDDYDKQSIYALLYSLYRSVGTVRSDSGEPYELTFNTWGYAWPKEWGTNSTTRATDPERFGKNAYTGLFECAPVKEYLAARDGRVHVVEMGCGTGAGAHHICKNVLPRCTYEAVDMQQAAIKTCRRKFVPELGGRLVATHANATKLPVASESADLVVVCETQVTEHAGQVTAEDRQFFGNARRVLKPGGFLVWGNAIPDSTWGPCFEHLESVGMKKVAERDVTKEAVTARDEDDRRVHTYVDTCIDRFWGFRIPVLGRKKRLEAEAAMKNFYRNPGTNLYDNMTNGTDTYKVVAFQKTA